MSRATHAITTRTESETQALGAALATLVSPGLTVLLSGEIGAGKSTLARAFVRARLGNPDEDVPSPTFTLVQVYEDTDGDIWHCDLYRLGDPQEVVELGLDEAMQTAICLIEWPDRLADMTPANALEIQMAAGDDGHHITLTGPTALIDGIAAAHV